MQIILDLNKDVEEKVQKILQPLLLQNNCTTNKINTPTWVFIKCSTKLSKKKCGKLTGWQVQESLKKQIIEVYGGLKIKQEKLYLQLYMKLKAENENPKQDHYYFCKVNLGPCSRKYLVTGHLIRFEVTLQDLRFEFEVEQSKPCKNLRILKFIKK